MQNATSLSKYQQRFLSSCVPFDATTKAVSMYYRLLCTKFIVERTFKTSVHNSVICLGALLGWLVPVLISAKPNPHYGPAGRDATKA